MMTVQKVYTSLGYEEISEEQSNQKYLQKVAFYATLCNDTKLQKTDSEFIRIGDPTEIALIDLAISTHKDPIEMINSYPRIHELPFDSIRKLMTTVHEIDGQWIAVVKGAPDVLMNRITSIEGTTIDRIKSFTKANQEMAEKSASCSCCWV